MKDQYKGFDYYFGLTTILLIIFLAVAKPDWGAAVLEFVLTLLGVVLILLTILTAWVMIVLDPIIRVFNWKIAFAAVSLIGVTITLFAFTLKFFRSRLKGRISRPLSSRFSRCSAFFFSPKTQREVFDPIVSDWNEEYFQLLEEEAFWQARMMNVRYVWAFILAAGQKSPVGEIFEIISKIAKI